jgi:tetratricopeptide (TPR) repeat protein
MSPKAWRPTVRACLALAVSLGFLGGSAGAGVYVWSFRWLNRARGNVDAGKANRAESDLRQFLKLHPRHPEGRLLLGLVLGHQRHWADAIEQFRQVPNCMPEAVEARWREGDAWFMMNRLADSEQALRKALELDPNHVESYRVLILLYRWQDRELEAQELLWHAFDRIPMSDRPGFLAEWFRIRYAQFQQEQILQRLRSSLQAQPDDVDSAIALAHWSYRDKKLNIARDLLEQCVERRPEIVQGRAVLIACYLDLGEGDRAAELLRQWPAEQYEYRYWSLFGRWQHEYGHNYELAVASLARALTERPDDWETRFRLAQCLGRQGQRLESECQMAEALRIREATSHDNVKVLLDKILPALALPSSRFRLGKFYEIVGYPREARCWYELALEVDPAHEASLMAISRLEANSGTQH